MWVEVCLDQIQVLKNSWSFNSLTESNCFPFYPNPRTQNSGANRRDWGQIKKLFRSPGDPDWCPRPSVELVNGLETIASISSSHYSLFTFQSYQIQFPFFANSGVSFTRLVSNLYTPMNYIQFICLSPSTVTMNVSIIPVLSLAAGSLLLFSLQIRNLILLL